MSGAGGLRALNVGSGLSLATNTDGSLSLGTSALQSILSAGTGTSLVNGSSIRSLVAGAGISLASDATTVTLSNSLASAGAGTAVLSGTKVRSLAVAGNNLALSQANDTITLTGSGVASVASGTGAGQGLLGTSGTATAPVLRTVTGAGTVSATASGDVLTLTSATDYTYAHSVNGGYNICQTKSIALDIDGVIVCQQY